MEKYLSELLGELVSIDTVSQNGNGHAADLLAERLDAGGFHVRLQETSEAPGRQTNVVAWAGPAEPDGLILSGHIDTVPFDAQPGWTLPPLALTERDDRLVGRGTTDMKGFIAQCLAAVRDVPLDKLERPIVFLFTCQEEIGCLGAGKLTDALPELLPDLPLPRLAWIGEPTSYRVFHAHKGVVDFAIHVEGQGGHSSLPALGCNAIAVAGKVLAEIGALQTEHRTQRSTTGEQLFPDAPYNTWNVGIIEGGSASNMIAESCRMRLSYRPLPDEDPLAAYRELAERLERLEERDDSGGDGRATISLGTPIAVAGLDSPAGTRLEQALGSTEAQRAGAPVSTDAQRAGAPVSTGGQRAGAPFCTDGGAFARAGIASLICGPGELAQAHQPDESIGAQALARGPEMIVDVIREVCGIRGG